MTTRPVIDRPVFIVGPHRSGTTLLYNIIGRHEQVCFLDRSNHRFPAYPGFARILGSILGTDPKPVEAQRFWDYLWPGPDDTMQAGDLTNQQREFYSSVISRILKQRGKTRLLPSTRGCPFVLDGFVPCFPMLNFCI